MLEVGLQPYLLLACMKPFLLEGSPEILEELLSVKRYADLEGFKSESVALVDLADEFLCCVDSWLHVNRHSRLCEQRISFEDATRYPIGDHKNICVRGSSVGFFGEGTGKNDRFGFMCSSLRLGIFPELTENLIVVDL